MISPYVSLEDLKAYPPVWSHNRPGKAVSVTTFLFYVLDQETPQMRLPKEMRFRGGKCTTEISITTETN